MRIETAANQRATCPSRWHDGPRWLAKALLLLGWATATMAGDDRDLSDFDHTRWATGQGLPGQVSGITQTADGYLWLATGQSLYRFDGAGFERVRTDDGGYFPMVSAMAPHPDGSLWLGLRYGGLARIKDGQTHFLGADEGVPGGIPYDLEVDATGLLLAAIDDRLFSGNQQGWRALALEGAADDPEPRIVFVDRDGGVWVGGARLWYRAPGTGRFKPVADALKGITAISESPDGQLWVAASEPARVVPVGPELEDGGVKGGVAIASSAMAFDHDGGLWLGTPGDGVRYAPPPGEPDNRATPQLLAPEGMSGGFIGAALTDREGNLWFGTDAGLDRFRQSDLVKVGFPSGAHNFALAVTADGAVWAGSLNRHAVRLVGGRVIPSLVPSPITAAQPSLDGGVWLAGPHGVWRAQGDDVARVLDLPEDVEAPAIVRALVEDGDRNLWASINKHGLYRFSDGTWHKEPAHGSLQTQTAPVRAVIDREGSPWFGYRDNLLVNIRNGVTRRWGPQDGLAVGHVTAITFTRTGQWVGGTTGLSHFDGSAFVPMRLADGFRISGLHGLVETVTGELWLHGNDGVLRIGADQIRQFMEDPTRPIRPRWLGPLEQLADDTRQLRPLPTAVSGSDGLVWLATSNGVRRVDPRRVARGTAPPPAHIVSILADEQPVKLITDPVLPPMTRRVVIAYTATGLKYSESLRFRYRLVGHEQAWHEPGTAREATYLGLAPGDYVFELAAAYGDGPWSNSDVLAFRLEPALHQTRTFIVACVAAALWALWFAYRWRIRRLASALSERLEERHRERERIARELHDTLLQSVQGLILRFQTASDRLPPDEPARRAIESALDQADKVMEEGRDRVSDLRVHEPVAGELLQALASVGHELAAVHGVRFRAVAQGKLRALPCNIQDQLFRIAREALINAFRHANANGVEMEIDCDRDGFRLRIRDDGTGIPANVLKRGGRHGHWGLAGMRERAESIGATFELWSRQGSGTEVEIRLPWERTSPATRPGSTWRSWTGWLTGRN